MTKATYGLLTLVGVWAVGAVTLRRDIRRVAAGLQDEMNAELQKKAPEYKGRIEVKAESSFTYKVKIALVDEKGITQRVLETEHCRYLGWFRASTWLAGTISEVQLELDKAA